MASCAHVDLCRLCAYSCMLVVSLSSLVVIAGSPQIDSDGQQYQQKLQLGSPKHFQGASSPNLVEPFRGPRSPANYTRGSPPSFSPQQSPGNSLAS